MVQSAPLLHERSFKKESETKNKKSAVLYFSVMSTFSLLSSGDYIKVKELVEGERRSMQIDNSNNGISHCGQQLLVLLLLVASKAQTRCASRVFRPCRAIFSVPIIHRTVTWTTGSLPCVRDQLTRVYT